MVRVAAVVACLLAALVARPLEAAEIVTITPEWLAGPGSDRHAAPPAGKEADWILGDHLLRNDRIVAVIADPIPGRHANMTVRTVGGCIIDLTTVADPNDQLSCWYPGDGTVAYARAGAGVDGRDVAGAEQGPLAVRGKTVSLRVAAPPREGAAGVEVTYTLADGDDFLTVTSRFVNPHAGPVTVELRDAVRADKTFTVGVDEASRCIWWDDEWFGQAYAIVPVDALVAPAAPAGAGAAAGRGPRDPVRYAVDGRTTVEIPAGGSRQLVRRVFPAPNLLAARALASRTAGMAAGADAPVTVAVTDPQGPVPRALVEVFAAERKHGGGWTGADGRLAFSLPAAASPWRIVATSVGRGSAEAAVTIRSDVPAAVPLGLPAPGVVVATISDESGGPIPCKVQFRRRDGAAGPDPDFGPDSADTAVRNLVYSHDGRFRRVLPPGAYDVLVSLGTEYDALTIPLTVERGVETALTGTLRRVVDTRGWVSADFHSHATPSGDNTTSQLGRVQNLLCEQIEFAPCTEHNRISSYLPHLERLGAVGRMATCSGMELTGSLLPVNHQNAFPLVEKPFTQDGGGPTADNADPVAQIERLALWDDGAEKLVQMNHPNLVQVLGDRDTDGARDGGFEGMLGFVDVIEVHPLEEIFAPPAPLADPRKRSGTILTWLQMLNLGYRVPGVANTDAHYAFHGSGWLRNYVASPTDDPAAIAVADVVRACERGRIVMTNGPFLGVRVATEAAGVAGEAGPGDAVADADGSVRLTIRVQCPNWFDVDRVQVFVNGRAEPALNFTRRDQATLFSRDAVRFAHECTVALERDSHLVVATIGEGSSLGVVMGPDHAGDRPVAVANPVFVDVGGDGFTPSGDLLGRPIPHQERPTERRHVHPQAQPHPPGR